MIGYDLRLAALSLRRTPLLSSLIVLGIGLGIAVSITFYAIHHTFAADPIPTRSDVLHYVRVDGWDPAKPFPGRNGSDLPIAMTYLDAVGLAASDVPTRRSITYPSRLVLRPEAEHERPFPVAARVCQGDFFDMMDVPLRDGAGWDRTADEAREAVCVLDAELNERLFGDESGVGRTVTLEDREFTVVGVLEPWRPFVRYWEGVNSPIGDPASVYVPFELAIEMQVPNSGNDYGWGAEEGEGYESFLRSESCWLGFWVELSGRQRVEEFEGFVTAYIQDQKRLGRFQRPLAFAVTPVRDYLDEMGVVPEEVSALLRVSLLFLLLCVLNVIGLLLGKFLARAPEAGTRRAMGASRARIFRQLLVESELVGLLGGACGLVLGGLLLLWINRMPMGLEFRFLDGNVLLASVGLSLGAGFLAGLYPAWRICTLPPAVYLKQS